MTRLACLAILLAALSSCGRSDDRPRHRPVDAPPPADAFTGPPDARALARAYVEALARADRTAATALLITPEINRALYACDERPDYPVDDRVRESMEKAMEPFTFGLDQARIEIGAWTLRHRKSYTAGETVTFICRTRRALAIVVGELPLSVIRDTDRRSMMLTFVLVESNGSARISDVTVR